jgi:hypothetical protein
MQVALLELGYETEWVDKSYNYGSNVTCEDIPTADEECVNSKAQGTWVAGISSSTTASKWSSRYSRSAA